MTATRRVLERVSLDGDINLHLTVNFFSRAVSSHGMFRKIHIAVHTPFFIAFRLLESGQKTATFASSLSRL